MTPSPEQLRQIADHVESADRVMLNVWASSSDPRRHEAIAVIRSGRMASDLRSWADDIEKGLTHA